MPLVCALVASGCPSARTPVTESPALDDGACARPLGPVRELWSSPTLASVTDGAQTFFVDRKDGHLRVSAGDMPASVVAEEVVAGAERVRWGWLLVDRLFVYWIPGQVEGPRSSNVRLVRVPRRGGKPERGFKPSGPVISAHVDAWGGLLLTEAGLWRLDLRDWGKARLVRSGQFSTMVADPRNAYLRPVDELGPMDFVAHQVMEGGGSCHEPRSSSIVRVDRQSGAVSPVFESKELRLYGSLASDETHLYTAAEPPSPPGEEKSCRVRRLLRISKESGAVQARRVPAGIGGELLGHGGQLFWLDGGGRLFRTAKTGGNVSVIAQLPCRPVRMAAAGASIQVWKADGPCGLSQVAVTGELASAVATLEAGDALLTVAGGWIYVANGEDQLRRISLQTGAAEPIRAGNGAPVIAIQAAVLGEALYFVGPDFLGRWSPASNEITRIYEGQARALAPDGDELYVATADGTIAVLGKTGAARTVLAGGGTAVRDLTALHRAVYWIEGTAPGRGRGRALWTARPDGQRTQLLSIEGMDQIATDGRAIFYATEGRSRLLPGERELPGTVMRFQDGVPTQLADRQETVTDLRASRRGVFWRQRRGVRWIEDAGTLRALDCTVADQGVGLVEADGAVYWADGTARAVMMVKLPR